MRELLAGRYRLGDILGRGGSADVYAAHDELLDRAVAVKWARVATDDSVRAQAVAVARLVHPRIVRVLDLGSTGGCDWAVLDLVEGLSARELLSQGSGPTATEAVSALVGVLEGLVYLHGQGVRHLDVSPGNLLVPTAAGRPCWAQVRLTDLAAPVEVGGRVVVSPHYVAPEVARGQPGDERADLYSAGATLMHLLTGAPPFDRADPAQLLVAHVNDLVEPPSSRLPGLPRVLDDVVLTALAKAPADRYPDAGAMGRALRDVDLGLRPNAPAATVARRPSPVVDGRTRQMQPVRPVVEPAEPAEPAVPAVAWMPSSRPAQVPSPHPVRPARAVPVGALLLALVAVGVGTGAALSRPTGASAMPTGAGTVMSVAAVVDQLPSAPATSSAPPATVAVPALLGGGLEAARAELEAVGLVLGDVGTVDGPSAAGSVLTSDPEQGAQVAPGAVVTVVVASGWTTVPALAGLAPAAVDEALAAAGLAVQGIGGGTGAADTVTGSQPAVGARVEVGSRVRLVVADRPPAPAFTASATPTSTSPGTPVPSATPTATPTPG